MSANTFTLEAAAAANIQVVGSDKGSQAVHDLIVAYQANRRTGSANSKTRAEVSGNNKKIFRQKGTGNARHGDKRAPIFVGGGVVFGPHPRDYSFKVNKKEIKLAIRSALSAKLADEQLIVVDKFDFEKPCTKDAVAVLKALEVEGRCTIVVNDENVNAFLSFRNIPTVDIVPSGYENVYELLDNKFLIFEEEALRKLEEAMA